MNYSCLSAASVLRCEALSRVQSGIAFIPCVLQIFILFLLLYIRGTNRWKWLLIGESSATFVLTLVDLLSHVLPQAQSSLGVFKAFDIAIAALSFVPVFLYSLILYGFAREQGFRILPQRSKTVTHAVLVVFVLLIVITNELGSFIGISRRTFTDQFGDPFLAIGFSNATDQTLWLLFTSIELALLLILQGFTFSYIFYLIIQGIQERRLDGESAALEWSVTHSVEGNIWISVGVKLGVIEVVLGFVQGGFGVVFARRFLRMVSRVCIFAGVLDYSNSLPSSQASHGIHRRNRSADQLRTMISAPRTNTFNRLSAGASNFYALPRARSNSRGFVPIMEETARPRNERVTVMYDGATAPTLNLRLSDFEVPTPEAILQSSSRRRGDSRAGTSRSRGSSSNVGSLPSSQQMAERMPIGVAVTTEQQQPFRRAVLRDARPRGERVLSNASLASESGFELASQFPGLPPRVTERSRSGSLSLGRVMEQVENPYGGIEYDSDSNNARRGGDVSTTGAEHSHGTSSSPQSSQKSVLSSNSLKRKAVPVPPPIATSIADEPIQPDPETLDSPDTMTSTSPFDRAKGRTATTSASTSPWLMTEPSSADTRSTGNPFEKYMYRESQLFNSGRGLGTIAQRVLEGERSPQAGSSKGIFTNVGRRAVELEEEDPSSYEAVATASTLAENVSARSSLAYPEASTIQHARRERFSLGEAMQRGGNVSRIKSIGVVSPRQTPTPSVSEYTRQSMKVLEDDIGDIPTTLPPSRGSIQQSIAGSAVSLMQDDAGQHESRSEHRTENTGEWMV